MKRLLLLFVPLVFFFGCEDVTNDEISEELALDTELFGIWYRAGGVFFDTSVNNWAEVPAVSLSFSSNGKCFESLSWQNAVVTNCTYNWWVQDGFLFLESESDCSSWSTSYSFESLEYGCEDVTYVAEGLSISHYVSMPGFGIDCSYPDPNYFIKQDD